MDRKIDIDPSAGFCFGVEKAIDVAEGLLKDGKTVLALGEMVHNEEETGRLEKLGMKTIHHNELADAGNAFVILRAHGEPPSTYQTAKVHKVNLVDATCPIVLSLQKKIKKRYQALDREREQIVIFGKEGHPETIGLMGQTDHSAILVTHPEKTGHVDPGKKVYLYSQTTMDPDQYRELERNLKQRAGLAGSAGLESNCTICNQMKRRKPDLKSFALQHDIMLFVSGKSSSNGAMLYRFCKLHNPNTHWIHSIRDIRAEWFIDGGSIGISGATSTPVWQLEQVKSHLQSLMID